LLSPKNVGKFAIDGLKSGEREEVAGCDPGRGGESMEFGANDAIGGDDDALISGSKEDL
jgi:hypothetical protein